MQLLGCFCQVLVPGDGLDIAKRTGIHMCSSGTVLRKKMQ